jgi:hypothetical protein
MTQIDINEYELTKDDPRYQITATKMTFLNLGNVPVYIGLIPVMPGDVYQINYEHPHVISHRFSIRFVTSATPVGATDREALGLVNTPYLVIQTATPK